MMRRLGAPIALSAIGALTGCQSTPSVASREHDQSGPPRIVILDMKVTLDEVATGAPGKIGQVDRLRLVYDANAVDTKTQRVRLLNLQHFQDGKFEPQAPDPVMMPTDDSWLDLHQRPYRLHFKAAVVHGQAIIIEVNENTRRLSIHPQSDPTAIIEAGPYQIDSTPVT